MKLIFYQHFDLQQEFHTSLISFLNFELRIFKKKIINQKLSESISRSICAKKDWSLTFEKRNFEPEYEPYKLYHMVHMIWFIVHVAHDMGYI